MAIKIDNPAGRLHTIIAAALTQPPNVSVYSVLETTLKVSNRRDFFERMQYFVALVEQVHSMITTLDESKKVLFEDKFKPINTLVGMNNFELPWKNFTHIFGEAFMHNLAVLSEFAPDIYKEKSIEENLLSDLIFEIDELIKNIQESDLIPELRQLIIDQLLLIQKSIREYFIRGADGLRKAFEACVAEFIYKYDLFRKETSNSSEIPQRYKTILMKLHQIVVNAYAYYQIADTAVKLLGPL
jgi:hypothetical protein